jgi:hypothetical protein
MGLSSERRNEPRQGRQKWLTNLLTHALFSTKDRQPIIRPETKSDLYAYRGFCRPGRGSKCPRECHSYSWLPPWATFCRPCRASLKR